MDPSDALIVTFTPPGRGEALTVPCPGDLRFGHELPGGHKSLSCTLTMPAGTATPAALQTLSRVRVVDRRTGSTVWWGELTDPGLSVTPDGQSYAITAEGGQTRLDGWREVYGLVDRAQDSWQAVGDFQGGSTSTSGDLTPIGDYDPGTIDVGGLGDEIGLDFPGTIGTEFPDAGFGDLGDPSFGNLNIDGSFDPASFDVGDFGGNLDAGFTNVDLGAGPDIVPGGNLDFTGADYPQPAAYPGYLGYLMNPLQLDPLHLSVAGVAPGTLPIPTGSTPADGSFWATFGPGRTSTGGLATGTTTGTLQRGQAPPGEIGRTGGLMQSPNMYSPSSPFWIHALGSELWFVGQVSCQFRFNAPGTGVRLWVWTGPTLDGTGYYLEATSDGRLAVCRAGGGQILSSTEFTASVGVTYSLIFDSFHPGSTSNVIRVGAVDPWYAGPWQPPVGTPIYRVGSGGGFSPGGLISAGAMSASTGAYYPPTFYVPVTGPITPGFTEIAYYGVHGRAWAEQPQVEDVLTEGSYWGVSAFGDGSADPQSVEFFTITGSRTTY